MLSNRKFNGNELKGNTFDSRIAGLYHEITHYYRITKTWRKGVTFKRQMQYEAFTNIDSEFIVKRLEIYENVNIIG